MDVGEYESRMLLSYLLALNWEKYMTPESLALMADHVGAGMERRKLVLLGT